VALYSYLDESGHSKDPNVSVLAIAGYLSSVAGWKRLVPDWIDTLSAFAVSALHMKDFAHSKGEFAGWNEGKRRALLARLVALMLRDIDAFIGEAMSLPEEWRQRPEELRERLADPYHGCLIYCLKTLISYSAHSVNHEEINVVLADHPEYSGWATAVYHAIKQDEDGGDRLGALTFDSPTGLVQLQAADLVAYELQHYLSETKPKGRPKKRWAMEQLLTKPCYFRQMKFREGDPGPGPHRE
jgi:hypothetical protein